MACTALMIRFNTTRLISAGMQQTGGNSRSKSVTISATCFHSLREMVIAPAIVWARSTGSFCLVPGCENSLIAPTMLVT